MAINNKGYVGKLDQWKPVEQRYIGVDGAWENEDFKFIGVRGNWKLTYTQNTIDKTKPFYLTDLQSYGVNNLNFLFMYGENFEDAQFVDPKIGGYFVLSKDGGDEFGNFVSGNLIGGTIGTIGGESGFIVGTDGDYFQLPPDPNAGITSTGLIGTTGDASFALSTWVYKPLNTSVNVPLFSFGNRVNGMDAWIGTDDKIYLKTYVGQSIQSSISTAVITPDVWKSVVLSKNGTDLSIYVGDSEVPAITQNLNFLEGSSTDVKIGALIEHTAVSQSARIYDLRTHDSYTLSNTDRTLTKVGTGFQTARVNGLISENTGKYYFEVKIDSIPTGETAWIGFSNPDNEISEAVGVAGWSIASNSRIFNKETGGGTVWNAGVSNFTTGDVIAITYDSGTKDFSLFKNNTLIAYIPFTGVSGDLEIMLAGTTGVQMTTQLTTTEFTYTKPTDSSAIPNGTIYTNPTTTSAVGSGFRNVFASGDYVLTDDNRYRLVNLAKPKVVFTDGTQEYIVPPEYFLSTDNKKLGVTIPPTLPVGMYKLFVRMGTVDSFKLPVVISDVLVEDNVFEDNFTNSETLRDNYYLLHRQWGGANGGVVADNVNFDSTNGELVLTANGDNYTGDIQGVDRDYRPKIHDNPNDPQYLEPWTNRVGGCAVYNKKTGYGSYEVEAIIPNTLGVASAFWTFFYNEIYPQDPRYDEFLQGTVTETQTNPDLVSQFTLEGDSYLNSMGGTIEMRPTTPVDTVFTDFSTGVRGTKYTGTTGWAYYLYGMNYFPDLTQAFTISLSVRINAVGTANKMNNLISLGYGAGSYGIMVNHLNATTVSIRAAIRTDSNETVITPYQINTSYGVKKQVTMTFDPSLSTGHLKMYWDGVLMSELDKPTSVLTPSNEWRVDQVNTITGGYNYATRDNEIADVRIYDKALTASEVSEISNEVGTLDTVEVEVSGGEGLHVSGNEAEGYYVVRNHEIDIEFPSHLDGGTLSQPSLNNMKCNTWRGELKNWSVPTTDPNYWEEYRDNLTPVGFNPAADGQFHSYRFDWYHDRVEFFIDGVLKQTNTSSIPDIAGYFTFGLWFPSSPKPDKPWLAEPTRAWAGGVVDADGGMKADFDQVEMRVRKFKYTPFTSENTQYLRKEAETYPFGGYRIYNKV